MFAVILIPAMIRIMQWGGESFYIYIWVFFQLLIVAMMYIIPNFIMPLFNKFETIKDEGLRKSIEEL